ncbi:MAG: hypothetical protein LBU57_00225 [Dysgonamonadaceae bacterium]|jgi:hypothetical protein|nr:hypothetical protein [Dysgonamonadaceae bacterium]
MTSETKGKVYVKKIIEEYNVFLQSWGHSDTWDLSRFKTLEDMIFEITRINVNANTLKRFFQQRTENPQLATKDALCRFLGYSGYTDFVLKKTKKEEIQDLSQNTTQGQTKKTDTDEDISGSQRKNNEKNQIKYAGNSPQFKKERNKWYIYIITSITILILGYFAYTYKLKDMYINHLISSIVFSASKVKGTGPLTITFFYKISSLLFDDISIVYEESNGDITEKNLFKNTEKVNATYIYEGEAYCYLKYKGKNIRTIHLEILKPGWSVHVREEKKKFFKVLPISQAFNPGKYVSLPIDSVPTEARANHLFVSYVFYKEYLVDGDNFIYEARLRNSAAENAIPLSDIVMYIRSDTNMHGFAMNENGYAYIKFISGEKTIKGDEYNLSRFNFNSSEWHIMKIKVVNKKTTFYVDGKEILGMDYNEPLGYANELILRFKGCGAVDYVKIFTLDEKLIFEENFDRIIR